MTFQELCSELENILLAEPGSVQPDTLLAQVGAWDSLARVMFIALVDERLGREIDVELLRKCKTVNDLAALVGVEAPVA